MAQTGNETSRKTYEKTRGPLKLESSISQEQQESKGWYWCHEKQGLFRYSDWHKSLEELNLISS